MSNPWSGDENEEMRDAGVLVRDQGCEPEIWVRLDVLGCKAAIEAVDMDWGVATTSLLDDQLHLVAKLCRQLGIGKQTYQIRLDVPADLCGYFEVEAFNASEAETLAATVTDEIELTLMASDQSGLVLDGVDVDVAPEWGSETLSAEEF